MKNNRNRNYDADAKRDREEIIWRLKQRQSYAEIMEELGCSLSHVQSIAVAHGLSQRCRPTYEDSFKALFLMATTDEPIAQIADRVALSVHQCYKIAEAGRKAGFDIYKPRGRPRKKL